VVPADSPVSVSVQMVPLIVPLPFLGLHVFVSFLQAYIFMLLTMVYVNDVLPHEEHEH